MQEATLGVTIRQLYRSAAAIIDRHIVISRYGRAVAFVGPLPEDYQPTSFDRMHVAPKFEGMAPLSSEDPEPDVSNEEIAELTEKERYMLAMIMAAGPIGGCHNRWKRLA